MVTMEQITGYLESRCASRAAAGYKKKRMIGQVELLSPYTVYDTATLYLKPEEEGCCLWLWSFFD